MKWTDTRQIAEALLDAHGETDPKRIRFTDLHQWVHELARLPGRSRSLQRKDPGSHSDGVDRRSLLTESLLGVSQNRQSGRILAVRCGSDGAQTPEISP